MGEKEGLQVNMVLYSPAMSMAAPGMAVHHSAFPSFDEWGQWGNKDLAKIITPSSPVHSRPVCSLLSSK